MVVRGGVLLAASSVSSRFGLLPSPAGRGGEGRWWEQDVQVAATSASCVRARCRVGWRLGGCGEGAPWLCAFTVFSTPSLAADGLCSLYMSGVLPFSRMAAAWCLLLRRARRWRSSGVAVVQRRLQARSGSVEGSLKLRNLFGYADIWEASGAYGGHQLSEMSVGVSLPRLKSIPTPLTARASVLSQDWLKFSSYKERLLGLSFGLLSTRHHELSYNLTWRTLSDPSQMASKSIRSQLGHNLLSALRYTYEVDHRDSRVRPTKGYAFASTSQVGGLWDRSGLKFFRQEFDVRGAVPFGFYNAALNFGIKAGLILPLGRRFMELTSPIPERFYLGGQFSPVCDLGGLSSLLGFGKRGVGPSEPRRFVPSGSVTDDSAASPGRDYIGGDLAVSAFADLSFDLPIKLLKDNGIHGHAFLSAGNVAKLSEGEYKNFSFPEFGRTFRSSAGIGIIVPTNLFRMEINYCYILKKCKHDRGKAGIQFSFSSPF